MAESSFRCWAVVELLGHRREAGHVSEVTIAGVPMLRIEVHGEGVALRVAFHAGAALYGLHPCTEAVARAVAADGYSPAAAWGGLELPASCSPAAGDAACSSSCCRAHMPDCGEGEGDGECLGECRPECAGCGEVPCDCDGAGFRRREDDGRVSGFGGGPCGGSSCDGCGDVACLGACGGGAVLEVSPASVDALPAGLAERLIAEVAAANPGQDPASIGIHLLSIEPGECPDPEVCVVASGPATDKRAAALGEPCPVAGCGLPSNWREADGGVLCCVHSSSAAVLSPAPLPELGPDDYPF